MVMRGHEGWGNKQKERPGKLSRAPFDDLADAFGLTIERVGPYFGTEPCSTCSPTLRR